MQCVNYMHPLVKGDNLTATARKLESGKRVRDRMEVSIIQSTNRKSHTA